MYIELSVGCVEGEGWNINGYVCDLCRRIILECKLNSVWVVNREILGM